MSLEKRFRCIYCEKVFTRKIWYDKHAGTCTKKARFDRLHNMDGIHGLKLFQHWSSRQGFTKRGKTRTREEFIKSPYYDTFMKLVKFAKDNYVISSYRYLDWIIDHRIVERDWFKSASLTTYRQYIRALDNPEEQTAISIRNAINWSNETKADIKTFFTTITPGEALNWLSLNKLSPWVLFGYEKAIVELLSRFDDEKLHILDERCNTDYWLDKVTSETNNRAIVQETCQRIFE